MSQNIEKEIKLEPKTEVQAKLIAKDFKMDLVKNIQTSLKLAEFNFLERRQIKIIDDYYDTEEFDLKEIGSGIRIRNVGSQKYLTIKKKYGKEQVGERSWQEQTTKINKQELIGHLESNFYNSTKKFFKELEGRKFEKKLSLQNTRIVYKIIRRDEIYQLSLDTYTYLFPKVIEKQNTYFEIEIEAKSQEGFKMLTSLKIDIEKSLTNFTFSKGDKYSRGVNLVKEKLLPDNKKLQKLLRENKKTTSLSIILAIVGILIAIYFGLMTLM